MTENHGVASSILALGILSLLIGKPAGIVQLVERLLAKEKVTGSSPVARSAVQWLMAKRKTFAISRLIHGDVAKLVRQGSAKP